MVALLLLRFLGSWVTTWQGSPSVGCCTPQALCTQELVPSRAPVSGLMCSRTHVRHPCNCCWAPSCGLLCSNEVVGEVDPQECWWSAGEGSSPVLGLAELLSWGLAVAGVVVLGLQVSAAC